MILSGIQAMLPALGHEWYEETGELNEIKNQQFIVGQPSWTLDEIVIDANFPIIKVMNNGTISMLYQIDNFPANTDTLKYGIKEIGESWTFETITTESMPGKQIDLVLDSNNNPHIVYLSNFPNNDLKYGSKNSDGTWNLQTIDTGENYFPSLVLDSNDNPHILYGGNSNDELHYAYFDGFSWFEGINLEN
ncbi:MAG: hypothetical protein CMA34_02135, partial [Euryarchaeota archaeon]|nr:hypothetical protein [Euryarchaeota archaeon]